MLMRYEGESVFECDFADDYMPRPSLISIFSDVTVMKSFGNGIIVKISSIADSHWNIYAIITLIRLK